MGVGIYTIGFFSILGFILDVSWSLINSVGALVWLIVCLVTDSGAVDPTDDSQRSGTFVFARNPRGGPYGATTIGTCIAGGWCSHEETHVWQARLFGPAYFLTYVVSYGLNVIFRLCTFQVGDISLEGYYRICMEDWAYAAGALSGGDIDWGMWLLWFTLTALYVGLLVTLVVGFALKLLVVGFIGLGGIVLYSIIRALCPRPAGQGS
jgi:hypothetical protein